MDGVIIFIGIMAAVTFLVMCTVVSLFWDLRTYKIPHLRDALIGIEGTLKGISEDIITLKIRGNGEMSPPTVWHLPRTPKDKQDTKKERETPPPVVGEVEEGVDDWTKY